VSYAITTDRRVGECLVHSLQAFIDSDHHYAASLDDEIKQVIAQIVHDYPTPAPALETQGGRRGPSTEPAFPIEWTQNSQLRQ
jgi:hypothetical protein